MAQYSIPDAVAQVNLTALYDTTGHAHYVPAPTVAWYRSQGKRTVTVTLVINDSGVSDEWLTPTQAAKQHVADVDGITEREAYQAILYACRAGRITSTGDRSNRRIEPTSFQAWRLSRREENLAEDDE